MPHEPFDASVIRAGGYDPAIGPREVAFRTHRIYRYRDVPPAEGRALEDAEAAGASVSAPIRNAAEGGGRGNLARATPQQATPL